MPKPHHNVKNLKSKKDDKQRFLKNASFQRDDRHVKSFLRNFDATQNSEDLPFNSRKNDHGLQ